jgi:hypothetical protein
MWSRQVTRVSFWSRLGCAAVVFGLASGAVVSACSSATRTEVVQTLKSSDGLYVVQVERVDTHGPGNHSGATIVKLSVSGTDQYREVAILNDNNVDVPSVAASWLGPNHLNIVYAKANVGFQAIKFGLVEITYENTE